MALGQVGHLSGPIVHLKVDIMVKVTLPRRSHLLVPDTL
jgi:hypothetical protein